MNKLLIMAAAAGLMLASCTSDNEDIKPAEPEQEISFAAPLMHRISRVGEISGAKYPKTEKFVVYGVKYDAKKSYPGWGQEGTAQEFTVEGTEVSPRMALGANPDDDPIGWFPQYIHYFKRYFNYAFGAYSPSSFTQGVSYSSNEGLQIADFVPAELGNQTDIMYAPRVYDKNRESGFNHGMGSEGGASNGNKYYDGVNLAFKHALTSVHFRVCVDPQFYGKMKNAGYDLFDGDFKIKSITVKNVKNKGSFNEGITNETSTTKNVYAANPKWTVDGTVKKDYEFMTDGSYQDIKVPVIGENTVRKAAKDITTLIGGQYGLVIPQEIGSDMEVVIEWQLVTHHPNGTLSKDNYTSSFKIADKNTEWKAGKRYIYDIAFSEEVIFFAPSVEDWSDEDFTDPNDVFNP